MHTHICLLTTQMTVTHPGHGYPSGADQLQLDSLWVLEGVLTLIRKTSPVLTDWLGVLCIYLQWLLLEGCLGHIFIVDPPDHHVCH